MSKYLNVLEKKGLYPTTKVVGIRPKKFYKIGGLIQSLHIKFI